MRRYLIPAVVLLSCFACSVQPEELPELAPSQKQKERIVITAHQEEDNPGGTRTMLKADDGATILWMAGDAINVFCGSQSEKFVSTLTEGTSNQTTDFKGDIVPEDGAMYYGLYPYDGEASLSSDGIITTSLPSLQSAVAGTFADDLFISVGRAKGAGTSLEMPFYNVCSGIRFTVDRADISSLTFTANGGESLAGEFRIGFDDETERPYVQGINEGYSSITVTAPEGHDYFEQGVSYYLIALPVELSQGFTITMDGDKVHASVRSSKSITLNRSRFRRAELTSSLYDSIDLDIEAEKVRAYLEETDYSDDLTDYSRSDISKYTSGSSSGGSSGGGGGPGGGSSGGGSSSSSREDYPAPVTFHWASAQERTLEYSTNADYSNATDVSVNASATSTEIYNLIPGKTYYWRSVGSDGTLLNESTFVPVGPLRMIYSSTRNVRDMGGWKAGEKTVAYGKLYRGAEISSKDQELFVNTLGINVDIDLRGKSGSQVLSVVEYLSYAPVMFMNGSGDTAEEYQKALRDVISRLSTGKTVYFHCMAGADRTGTLAFIIGALLGVSESDLSKDFELTSFYSTRKRTAESQYPFKKLVFYLKDFEGNTIQEKVESWAKTSFSSSVTPISDEEIMALREVMLE